MHLKKSLITVLFLFTILSVTQAAEVIYVDTDASGSNNGTSWLNAYNYLQDALAAASSGAEIWVAEGTYYPDDGTGQIDNDPTSAFELKDGVSVYGGFNATETLLSQRDFSSYITTLDGDLDQSVTTANNAYHIVANTSAQTSTAVLDGFTLTNGYANSTETNKAGGAMLNQSSSPTINNCIFTGNYGNNGGAVYNISSSAIFNYCTFSGNSCLTVCGAIAVDGGSTTISNSSFEDNNGAFLGGGISYYTESGSHTGTHTITACTFSNNNTAYDGGAFYNDDGTIACSNSKFTDNAANGGAFYNNTGTVTCTNCLMYDNTNNSGTYDTIFNNAGIVNLTNCTFSVTSPESHKELGNLGSATMNINNCILWGEDDSINNTGTLVVNYSDIQSASGAYTGTGNINDDPIFTNGYHLDDTSPCIGTGTATGAPTKDIEDNDRGTPPDMGAYENARDTSLPVELTSMNAEPVTGAVILTWTTQSETDNLGFILERAAMENPGELKWQVIANYNINYQLLGAGSTTNQSEYSFTDNTVKGGINYRYRLSDVDINGNVTFLAETALCSTPVPTTTLLMKAYPNPFNPTTQISYQLAKDTNVNLYITDILGRVVNTLVDQKQAAGIFNLLWDGSDMNEQLCSTGTYFIIMNAGNHIQMQKILLVK